MVLGLLQRALERRAALEVLGEALPPGEIERALRVANRERRLGRDLRGHLRLGPAPAPTPEQLAAYSDAGALEAEPATLIESGWAAAWLARLAAQLLAPSGLRERWLLELLASKQVCVLGGVGVEQTADGAAYGVALPGQNDPQQLGTIQLATFINPTGLKQIGENLFLPSAASGDPIVGDPAEGGRGTIQQGFLEGSNVDPVVELVQLIKTQRAFELNSQSIQAADEALQTIGRLRRF